MVLSQGTLKKAWYERHFLTSNNEYCEKHTWYSKPAIYNLQNLSSGGLTLAKLFDALRFTFLRLVFNNRELAYFNEYTNYNRKKRYVDFHEID